MWLAVFLPVGRVAAATTVAPTKPKVAVLPISIEGEIAPHLVERLNERLVDGLQRGAFDVVTPDPPAAQDCASDECRRELAGRLGAAYFVHAEVSVVDTDFRTRIFLVQADSATRIARSEEACQLCGAKEAGDLLADQAAAMRRKLEPLLRGPPVIVIESEPAGAEISLDGQRIGDTPLEQEVPPGRHLIRAERRGYVTVEREVLAVSGVSERVQIELRPKPGRKLGPWGWVLLGVGAATAGSGAALIAIDDRPYRTNCEADSMGDCRFLYDTINSGIALVAVGGAAIITGAILVGLSRRGNKPKRRARVTPFGLGARF